MRLTKSAQVVGGWEWEHFRRCADKASREVLEREAVVTAGYNGEHMKGSLHYVGRAWDLRVWRNHFDYDKGRFSVVKCKEYAQALRKHLGDCYDVVVHYKKDQHGGEYVSHIHVEMDLR